MDQQSQLTEQVKNIKDKIAVISSSLVFNKNKDQRTLL
jgi:nitrate reductase NapAB chaperone NapD